MLSPAKLGSFTFRRGPGDGATRRPRSRTAREFVCAEPLTDAETDDVRRALDTNAEHARVDSRTPREHADLDAARMAAGPPPGEARRVLQQVERAGVEHAAFATISARAGGPRSVFARVMRLQPGGLRRRSSDDASASRPRARRCRLGLHASLETPPRTPARAATAAG